MISSIMGCVAVGVKPEVQRRPARMEDASAVHAHVSHATANEEDDQSPMVFYSKFYQWHFSMLENEAS